MVDWQSRELTNVDGLMEIKEQRPLRLQRKGPVKLPEKEKQSALIATFLPRLI